MERALLNGFQSLLPGFDVQSLPKQFLRVIQIPNQCYCGQVCEIIRFLVLALAKNVIQYISADMTVRLSCCLGLSGRVGKCLQVFRGHGVVWINLQCSLEAGFSGILVVQIVETNSQGKNDLNILWQAGYGLTVKVSSFLVLFCLEIGRRQ